MNHKLLYFFGIGIIVTVSLASVLSIFFIPGIEWNRLDNGINPNRYTQDWNTLPLSELEDSSSKRFMSLEDAQLGLDEIHFEIKVPSRRTLPPNFSVVGVIYLPPSFHGPRGLIGASSPEMVILLLSDKPITMNMTKVEFDLSGGISFETLDYYRECPRYRTAYRDLWGPNIEKLDIRLLADRYPSLVSVTFVESCKWDEGVFYRVYGQYGAPELVSLMEHLLGM